MAYSDTGFPIFASKAANRKRPPDCDMTADLESLIRADYERCHPGETLYDLKLRARFAKEDKGLLRDWMGVAARRATMSAARRR